MKKKLNTEHITNELAGASLFFAPHKPAVQPPVPDTPLPEPPVIQDEQPKAIPYPVAERVPVRGGVPPPVPLIPKVKRPIRQRQPFDIYQDQYERLKQIAEAEKGFVNGRGMNQMVREAIDQYLKDHGSSNA